VVGCGGGVWEGGAAPPQEKIFIYKGSVVRVSASYSSDFTVILADSRNKDDSNPKNSNTVANSM